MRAPRYKGNTTIRYNTGGKVRNKYFIRMHGQSNSEGIVPVTWLPSSLQREFKNVYVYFNEDESVGGGAWQKLKAGTNNQRSTAAAGSDRLQWFGAEIAIADRFEFLHPNDELYISKYAVGGSPVAQDAGFVDWSTSSSDEALDIAIDNYDIPARAAISGSVTDLGMIWMQGEQDASSPTQSVTATFRTNTLNTFADFRSRLSLASMPIYVCRLNAAIARDATQLANVRTAQGTSAGNLTDTGTNPNNHHFDTDIFSLVPGDTVHFLQFNYGVSLYSAIGL